MRKRTQYSIFNIQYSARERGAFLLELLIVVALLGIILGVGAQAVYVSMQSGKVSGERDVATGIASEVLEAVRATTEEGWGNLATSTNSVPGTTQFYATTTIANKWTIATGTATTSVNGISYVTSFTIASTSRDVSTRLIDMGTNYDPSTRTVTVTTSWPNADAVVITDYFFRWKNRVCTQTSWTTGGSGNNAYTCPTTNYDTIDSGMSTTTGLHLI